ncbi:MAG: Crp/Fnr family transcriptional regulator [Bacteroidota bacterium]
MIEKGHVHLRRSHEYGKDYILLELGPGDFFGSASLLERTPYPYTAQVSGESCRCAQLPSDKFWELLNNDHNVASAVMHMLAGRILAGSEQLVNQAYDSVRRRTALVLCDLNEKHGGETITLPREELAQMVGTTKESVIRALSDFKQAELVEIRGSRIAVKKVDELRNLLV